MNLYVTFFYLIIGFTTSRGNRESNRIIGGHRAMKGEYPYVVSVGQGFGRHLCGGVIFDKLHIITAAHCFRGRKHFVFSFSIFAGDVDIINPSNGIQIIHVNEVVIHPEYDYLKRVNDIAVVLAADNIEYSPTVRPCKLSNNYPYKLKNCNVVGWGVIDALEKYQNRYLMSTHVSIYDFSYCLKPQLGPLDPKTQICAGEIQGGRDSCLGDSGGPLICDNIIEGLVSFGYNCGLPEFPAIYTAISPYYEWIHKIAARNGKETLASEKYLCVLFLISLFLLIDFNS